MAEYGSRGLPFRNWPQADICLWENLVTAGDPLDDPGALSHLRPVSLQSLQNGYGFFLRHAEREGALPLDPASRATLPLLRSYLASLHDLAPRTKAGYFASLAKVLTAAYPDADWRHLRRGCNTLMQRANKAGGQSDKSIVPFIPDLQELGHRLLAEGTTAETPRRKAEACRDGLMILLLASYPMRRKNFAQLELGRTLRYQKGTFIIALPGEDIKTHRPIQITVDETTGCLIKDFLRNIRPMFPGGGDPTSGRLWLRFTCGSWEMKGIGEHISRLTERGLGARITPHLFRAAAATTIADTEGADARIIRPLLGHVTGRTAEKHYIQAGQLSAARRYQGILHRIGKTGH